MSARVAASSSRARLTAFVRNGIRQTPGVVRQSFNPQFAVIWALLILVFAASVIHPSFTSTRNLANLLDQVSALGVVAAGMTFVILVGGFDLSVGSLFGAGAVVYLSLQGDVPVVVAIVATIAVGACCGLGNGLLVTRGRINPFVATLGSASVFLGAALVYSGSTAIFVEQASFSWLAQTKVAGLSVSVYISLATLLAGGFVLARTVYGREIYAVGGSLEAARLAGLRVDVIRGTTYVISGACAALGGIMIAARVATAQADIAPTVTLDAIAIVIIGGTSLLGGEGAMWRTVVGLFLIGVLNNVFDALAVDTAVQLMAKGAVVVAAVGLDGLMRSRR